MGLSFLQSIAGQREDWLIPLQGCWGSNTGPWGHWIRSGEDELIWLPLVSSLFLSLTTLGLLGLEFPATYKEEPFLSTNGGREVG